MELSLLTLETIHQRHTSTWAFENLDVFLTGRNRLDREGLNAKLGPKTRGGWCFELNEWMTLALEDAGFPVRRLLARNTNIPNRSRTHQIALTEIQNELWIMDGGYGSQTPRAPLKLEDGFICNRDGLSYRMARLQDPRTSLIREPDSWEVQLQQEGEWKAIYRFTLETATPADMEMGNNFHLTSPTSTFPDARMITKPIPNGRLSLVDRALKTSHYRNEEVSTTSQEYTCARDYGDALQKHFGLVLSDKAIDRLFNLEPSISRGNAPLEEEGY